MNLRSPVVAEVPGEAQFYCLPEHVPKIRCFDEVVRIQG